MRFIAYYRKINHKIVRKPYPLTRICETMHQMEVLQYVTALDLNMGYSTIELSPKGRELTTIVTDFFII